MPPARAYGDIMYLFHDAIIINELLQARSLFLRGGLTTIMNYCFRIISPTTCITFTLAAIYTGSLQARNTPADHVNDGKHLGDPMGSSPQIASSEKVTPSWGPPTTTYKHSNPQFIMPSTNHSRHEVHQRNWFKQEHYSFVTSKHYHNLRRSDAAFVF